MYNKNIINLKSLEDIIYEYSFLWIFISNK